MFKEDKVNTGNKRVKGKKIRLEVKVEFVGGAGGERMTLENDINKDTVGSL